MFKLLAIAALVVLALAAPADAQGPQCMLTGQSPDVGGVPGVGAGTMCFYTCPNGDEQSHDFEAPATCPATMEEDDD